MRNPVDFAIARTGLNRTEFAVKHGFGKNVLGRLVQGRLQSVTPRIQAALWSEWRDRGIDVDEFDAEYQTTDIDVAYQRWVSNRRITNRVKLPAKVKDDPSITPFARVVRAIGSVSKTAQTLAVADVVVQRYADGRQRTMPEAIREALTEMGYQHVEQLNTSQLRWHEKRGTS
jgi:hypothetical protein